MHTYRNSVQLLLSFYTVLACFFDNLTCFVRTQLSLFPTAVECALRVRHCKCLYDNGLQKAAFQLLKDGLLDGKTWLFGRRKATFVFFAAAATAECSLRVNFIYTYSRHGSRRTMRRP